MSKELKIGDQIQIDKIDEITQLVFPHLLGSHVTIVGFADNGQGVFADDSIPYEDCPYTRHDKEFIQVDEEFGWEFTIL